MNVVWTVSMSWSCAPLKSGTVCSRMLLTQPSTSTESDWECACMQLDNWTFIASACDWQKLWTNKIQVTQKDAPLLLTCDFRGLKVSQGKVHTINRWGGISNHLSMAYLLSNICTKNYWNRTTIVEITVGGWVISFFWDSVYYMVYFNTTYQQLRVFCIENTWLKSDVQCAHANMAKSLGYILTYPVDGSLRSMFAKFTCHESWRYNLLLVHSQVTTIFVVSVGLFVCAEFFSAVFDPILIKLEHMLYVWV